MEESLNVVRFARQNDLKCRGLSYLMMNNINKITDKRLIVLEEIEKHKIMVVKDYNKKVKIKSFQFKDLVYKIVLSLRSIDLNFKFSK